jgi:ribonuclease R
MRWVWNGWDILEVQRNGDLYHCLVLEEMHKLVIGKCVTCQYGAANALKKSCPYCRNHIKPDGEKSMQCMSTLRTLANFPREVNASGLSAHYWGDQRSSWCSIHVMLLRSMMQANYAPDSIRSFGSYDGCHLAIHSYPDLML